MPRTVNTGIYDFDPLMKNAANRVVNEKQVLAVPGRDDFHFLIPQAAPFFVSSLTVRNETTGETYEEGKDYVVGHWFVEAMTNTGRAVAGSVRFLRHDIAGIIVLGYHTLGGEWGFNNQAINKELSQRNLNPLVRSWAQIDVMPSTFPPIPHDQRVDTLVGFDDVTLKLEDIVQAIETAGSGAGEAHIDNKNNPHQTNKGHVGLGNVNNFLLAGEDEAREINSNTRYMTPWSTGISLDEFYTTRIAKYFDGTVENGTNVTKGQIGLGSVENHPIATPGEARDGLRNDRYMTPSLVSLLVDEKNATSVGGHVSDFNNPHRVTTDQIGAATIAELDAVRDGMNDYLLVDEKAADAVLFNGLTHEEYANNILQQKIADSERLDGKTLPEVEALFDRSFASQFTYFPIFVDAGSVSTDHQWLEVFKRSVGGRTTTVILALPNDGPDTSLVQITIPPSGGSFYMSVLNDIMPKAAIAVREIDADTHVLCVDVLGMIGSVSMMLMHQLDRNHTVTPIDDLTVYNHNANYELIEKGNVLPSEISTSLDEFTDEMESLFTSAASELA